MKKQQKHVLQVVSFLIVLIIIGVTFVLFPLVKKLKFTGAVSDLIVIEKDKPVLPSEKETYDKDQLVVVVSDPNLLSIGGLKEVKRITDELTKFVIGSENKSKEPKFLSSVLSITNTYLPKACPITDTGVDYKDKMGCAYALRYAENVYKKHLGDPRYEIRFDLNQKTIFPKFPPEDAFESSADYLSYDTFWQQMPKTKYDIYHFKFDVFQSMFIRNFISLSGHDTAIMLTVPRDTKYSTKFIISTIEKKLKNLQSKFKTTLVGELVLKEEVKENIIYDSKVFMKLSVLFWVISFGLSFWTIRGIVLPFLTLIISEIWLLAFMALMGYNLNVVYYIVPVFLVAIGSSASIHVISRFYLKLEEGLDKFEAALKSADELKLPIFSASSTTALGFATLFISNVKGLNVFSFLCILGLAFITFLSLVFIPAMNILLPKPKRFPKKYVKSEEFWEKFIDWILRWRTKLIIIFLFLLIISAIGIFYIIPDNDLTKLLGKNSQALNNLKQLSHKLSGTTFLTLLIKGKPGAFIQKENLRKLNEVHKRLEDSPYIDKCTSVTDFFKLTNYLSSAGINPEKKLFKYQYVINSHIHFIESLEKHEAFKENASALEDLLRSFASKDYSTALVTLRANTMSLRILNNEKLRIQKIARGVFGEDFEIKLKGEILNINKAVEKVIYGQTQSVILALVTIFLLMLLMFFSFKISILTIIPNIFPIVFFYGYLGVSKIGLDLSSGLVACIAIGIAVDDTIHFMTEMRHNLRKTYDVRDAMIKSIKIVGKPMILTSFVLAAMFGILWFSHFQVFVKLGILQSITMIVCLICNLILLPAILSSFRIVSIWSLLEEYEDFDINKIKVLEGLSLLGKKVVLGMGKIVEKKAGDLILREGDEGSEMYIIISGKVRIFKESGGKREELALLSEGDLFGEMAVFADHKRDASAEAVGDVVLIAISNDFFEHLEKLYPRTCSAFLKNVVGIVSERLRTMNYDFIRRIESPKKGANKYA